MPTTKLNNGQLPTTLSSKTIDNSNDINTTTTRLKISGGSNGQVLSTDGSSNLSWVTAGGVSDGDKGDITVASSGTVWTIDNGVVTYAKMQDVSASSRLIGRATAGSGDAEEITIGSGLSLSGTTLSALGAPTTVVTKTADETVTNSTTLQDDDHLSTSIVSGRYYDFEFILFVTRTNTTNGPSVKFAISANSDGYWGSIAIVPPTILLNGTSANSFSIGSNANVPMRVHLVGTIKATADSTLQLKFAQSSLFAGTGTTVMKNSRLLLWDLGT